MGARPEIAYRREVRAADADAVRDLVVSTGFFNTEEVDIAVELVNENLARGAEKSGYYFLFAEVEGRTVGYSCFGPIHGTQESFDLFWIVVHDDRRGRGIGRELMTASEAEIVRLAGHRVYVETSSRAQYEPTRRFYLSCGYEIEAVIRDFYAPGDGKVMMVKEI